MANRRKKPAVIYELNNTQIWEIFGTDLIKEVSARTKINAWADKGIVRRTKKIGGFDGRDFVKHLIEKAVKGPSSNNESISDEDDIANKTLFKKSKADMEAIEVKLETGELIERKELSGYMIDKMVSFKRALLSQSRSLPNDVYGMDGDLLRDTLDRRIHMTIERALGRVDTEDLLDRIKENTK